MELILTLILTVLWICFRRVDMFYFSFFLLSVDKSDVRLRLRCAHASQRVPVSSCSIFKPSFHVIFVGFMMPGSLPQVLSSLPRIAAIEEGAIPTRHKIFALCLTAVDSLHVSCVEAPEVGLF